jgi:glutathione-specific gamma-glutamylcyclotransferase
VSSASENRWVFGYGSLMWKPGFPYLRALPARLFGYHRRLCLYSHQYRGTPALPGLVFGLDKGGSCRGVAFEVAAAQWVETALYLREREQLSDVYIEAFKPARVAGLNEPVEALCYIVNRGHVQYAGELDPEVLVKVIKQGCGDMGRCEDYVRNTAEHLRQMKIPDRRLERIAKLLDGHC